MSTAVQNDHISASFGDRKPAYRNWFYVGVVFVTEQGHEVETARTDWTLRNVAQAIEGARKRVGTPVGFSGYTREIIKDFRVTTPTFRPHPDAIRVRVLPDAHLRLIAKLNESRDSRRPFTAEESRSVDFLRDVANQIFVVMHDEDVPQMSSAQFWNTMPYVGEKYAAPAGFFLPRGLCELVPPEVE